MRRLLMTAILLSVSLIGLIAPMHVRGENGVTSTTTSAHSTHAMTTTRTMANRTTSSMTNQTTTSASTSTSSTMSQPSGDFILKVDPPYRSIDLTNGKIRSATFSVEVRALSGFQGEVELSIEGLPESAEAAFNPEEGVPKPVFVSILKIFLSQSTPAGAYTLTIIAASNGVFQHATTTLVVEGSASTSATTMQQQQRRLRVSISTDRENYHKGDKVNISGYVKLRSGESVEGAAVSLNVIDPLGNEIHVRLALTDRNGRYWDNFALPLNTMDGTYTVYVVANMVTYQECFGQTTFVVGASDVPSIRIVNGTTAMLNGTVSSEFHPGETVVVWVAVDNSGADLRGGSTWVEVLDPNNIPISVTVVVVTIHSGEQTRIGIHVILKSDATIGIYAVRILVSNAPIMGGGKFLDGRETVFLVTG